MSVFFQFKLITRTSADDHVVGPDEDDAVQVGGERGEPHRDAERQLVRKNVRKKISIDHLKQFLLL